MNRPADVVAATAKCYINRLLQMYLLGDYKAKDTVKARPGDEAKLAMRDKLQHFDFTGRIAGLNGHMLPTRFLARSSPKKAILILKTNS